GSLVNVLSLVHAHCYFPCHSNGLKDVAGWLGCTWSEPDASGLQSLVWRTRWKATRDEGWKQKLAQYNLEDCLALKRVAEVLREAFAPVQDTGPGRGAEPGPPVSRVEEIDRLGTVTRRGKLSFFHPDFEHINDRAHFDYQRQHVYARKTKARK